jgi:anti-anti-sigma regulatory factor
MCRITTRTSVDELVIKLEGSLVGPWVRELDTCWRNAVPKLDGRRVRIDLTAVCHVDTAGRELITLMYRRGASFVASGCVMPEVLREIREITEASAALESCGERS